MSRIPWCLVAFVLIAATTVAEAQDFNKADDVKSWQTVSDGVMGGPSDGRFKINDGQKMELFGTLSLESNGGFASVRARGAKLDPTNVAGMGIVLSDKKAGPFKLEVEWIKTSTLLGEMFKVRAEGMYQHHLQGVCTDEKAIYWSFTTTLVKTDMKGNLLNKVPVANHHGDLCFHDGKLYVAVNLGKFNDPDGNADSWVYAYDAETLKQLVRYKTQEVFHGAGGIGIQNGHFFVVGGLPEGVEENYVYEYDEQFKFIKKHIIKSGHTHLGIQTATFAHDRWWFGCYGDPKILLVTDADFQMKGRYEFDCSLGIEGFDGGRLLVGSGRCEDDKGCIGTAQTADAAKFTK